jgi:protein-tyrosine-phosphatase
MAEVIFENLAKKNGREDIVVKSAGVMTLNGLPMTDTAAEALKVCGENVGRKKRKSTRYSFKMLPKFDHIITMTRGQKEHIGLFDNVYTLDELTSCGDVPDPFLQPLDVYVEVCKQLRVALGILWIRLCDA